MTSEWRTRWTHAQTRGRTIERQADGLRRALLRLANGEPGGSEDVAQSVLAMREQLAIAERLAASWEAGAIDID